LSGFDLDHGAMQQNGHCTILSRNSGLSRRFRHSEYALAFWSAPIAGVAVADIDPRLP
jgi:hypothetical protein